MARYWVGTSGWSYASWRNLVYTKGLRQGEWLGHYATLLNSVEINATFYRPPRKEMLEGWAARTPDDFLFAVKGWRAISHYRRLADCDDLVARFLAGLKPLGKKCGPVLFQLPPNFEPDPERLAAFLARLPKRGRFAIEFRDPRWHRDDIYALLKDRNVAFCLFELGKLVSPRVATADFVYLRLHGRKARYCGNYSEAALKDWAKDLKARMAEGRDVYAYFDNTDEADYAVKNARRLDALLGA